MTVETPGQAIPLTGVANLRDLGGWPTATGQVVAGGRVFRSAGLDRATDADLARLTALGVGTVVDLRTAGERAQAPDRIPDTATGIVADVLADFAQAAPANLEAALTDPAWTTANLSGGKAEELFAGAYRGVVSLDSALAAYRLMFTTLLDESDEPDEAMLFHCMTGKDRTGWGAAALLLLLGVSEQDVLREYLLTNDQLLPTLKPMFDDFAARGGDPEILQPVFGVRESYLRTALDEMSSRFGTVEGYFADGLGIGADGQESLRDRLLTS